MKKHPIVGELWVSGSSQDDLCFRVDEVDDVVKVVVLVVLVDVVVDDDDD